MRCRGPYIKVIGVPGFEHRTRGDEDILLSEIRRMGEARHGAGLGLYVEHFTPWQSFSPSVTDGAEYYQPQRNTGVQLAPCPAL
jgi:hypothetical protein